MWWLDPGKEVLNVVFNRILAPYVENLDMNQVNYGIGQGQLMLQKLRLKRGALDKFRLPVDVLEGHLGKFTLSLHWRNLGNQPVEVLIEDVYLLVVPSPHGDDDPEESERRMQAAKAERLENAELLHMRTQTNVAETSQQQGLLASLIAKIVNNLQITVKNIHIRYEDKISVPGHPFAAGFTLAGFSAYSVDENWVPAFIESTAGRIHKLAKLESLALYFDTDAKSMAGLPYEKAVEAFVSMIAREDSTQDHQFILKPVTGEGRIVMNNQLDKNTPRFDIKVLFDEIAVLLDDHQYRDVISLVDMFHVYARQHQYRRYKFAAEEEEENRPRALLKFAGQAILDGVHERNRKWTWAYFAERRDDRHRYVELFKKKQLSTQTPQDASVFAALETKLSYEDIRFYRSIARSELRKDQALREKLEEERKKQESTQSSSWTGWLWGSSSSQTTEEPTFHGPMTDEQRKELYDVLDYDEKTAMAESFEAARDALKMRVAAQLKKGSFGLRSDPHEANTEVISLVFDAFHADFLQRRDNFEASASLGGFGVFDGTTKGTLYPQIVHVKTDEGQGGHGGSTNGDPFFFVKFENNPLDEQADTALTVRMRHMEIIYHKGYVEAVYKFFRPPASQLQSVEALLNVASETLEGFRKETRAGLEYALQSHKTVDLQLDMNAPIIIIPESVTTSKCTYLLIDAGHIAIESNLANKAAIREVNAKRNQQYTDEDYARLEALMYDKFSLRLEAAQFVLGNDLTLCRQALTSDGTDALHLIERINLSLQVQNSIVPTAVNLAKFKISGTLPSLHVNFSDTKYKSILRLVDVTIPHFGDDSSSPSSSAEGPSNFQIPTGFFSFPEVEYNVDDGGDGDDDEKGDSQEQFFEAPQETPEDRAVHQKVFELNFRVDNLSASISKAKGEDGEKPLGAVAFHRFGLALWVAKYDMRVDVHLGSLSMSLNDSKSKPLEVLSSADGISDAQNLLTVGYTRVQRDSLDFVSVYDGIDQSVDMEISTVIFHASPEAVVTLYDFIMTTFVPPPPEGVATPSADVSSPESEQIMSTTQTQATSDQRMQVLVKLASVKVILVNKNSALATLALSTANARVALRPNAMDVHVHLGTLSLTDDSQLSTALPEFKQLMSIEGNNLAEIRYQTFDPTDKENYKGIKSAISLTAASVKLHVLEGPLHDLYVFLTKLAKLKGLYDAATQVAVQRASEIVRMQFEISVKSPIIVFPADPAASSDVLTMRLGEIAAKNNYADDSLKTSASLRGLQLVHTAYHDQKPSALKLIDDIEIVAEINQPNNTSDEEKPRQPDTQVIVTISDIKLFLTQAQYGILLAVLQSIPRVLAGAPEGHAQADNSADTPRLSPSPIQDDTNTDLRPELAIVKSGTVRATVDLVLTVNAVKLHLYDKDATTEVSLKDHGIARFALTNNTLRMKMLSDGAMEAQVVLKSFTMFDTRPGNSRYREIIPAARHQRNQFMILYTASGGPDPSSLAILTVDSPQIIFAIELVFALLGFFTSPFQVSPSSSDISSESQLLAEGESSSAPSRPFETDFRIDLHDVSISVLENDQVPDSQAVRLSVGQICLSQQGILALTVDHLGMSLTHMDKGAEDVRFLDNIDLTLSLDSRSSSSHQMTNIEITLKPIILRASYRDIRLILTIANKAMEAYAKQNNLSQQQGATSAKSTDSIADNSSRAGSKVRHSSKASQSQPIGQARVVMSREQLNASFDGLKLILIGDLHEQPMLHLQMRSFRVKAKDWSGELDASTTLATYVSYWNLTNSHWEPLFDPWTFTASVSKNTLSGTLTASLVSRERLNLNISTTFVELALETWNMLTKDSERVLQRARGSYAPYKIKNRTGTPLYVWSDADGSAEKKDVNATKLHDGQSIDWRFDDWRIMREHTSSGESSIAVQFIGQPWEQLRSIPVDREGEYTFSLRPKTDKLYSRLLCEVRVEANVKIVTLRSTYRIHNQTLYPVEVTLVDDDRSSHEIFKIAPGQDYSLPIHVVGKSKVRIQPDQGFGYKWSPAIRWDDLVSRQSFTLRCPHSDESEAAFRFHAFVQTDAGIGPLRRYPKINLKLRAPIELENLLPFNLQYRVYDKDTDQNWRSYLRQGGVMPVHSVELGHLVLLNIEIQDTIFKPSDFSIINTDGNSDYDIEKKLILQDPHGRKLDLRLNYMRYPDAGGAFKVQIYSPYLLVNKTGLSFGVRSVRSNRAGSPQDVAGDTRRDVLAGAGPFMLSHPNDAGREFVFQVGDSSWSKIINLEAPAAETELTIPSHSSKTQEIHVGMSWTEGLGKYKLTKVVTIAPRFLVKNDLGESISYREHGVAPRGRQILEPGERTVLHSMRMGYEKLLTIAFPGLNNQWSPPISIEDIGSVYFRLKKPGEQGNMHLIRADVKMEGATIFVFLKLSDSEWPFKIENDSSYPLSFCQMDLAHGNAEESSKSHPRYDMQEHSLTYYAWDYPAAAEKKILLSFHGHRRAVDILEIGNLVPFRFKTPYGIGVVSMDVRADGNMQILRISNYNQQTSVYQLTSNRSVRSSSASTLRSDSTLNAEAFEAVTEDAPPTLAFNIDFEGIGVSLINRRLVEVVYFLARNLKFEYSSNHIAQAVNVSCGTLQADNQLHDALYPVVLQPTPISTEASEVAALPTIQASVIWLNDQAHGVLFVKYCSILLQALTIEADEDFLYALYDLSQIKGASWEDGQEDVLVEHINDIPEPGDMNVGQVLYFEVLELQPIRLSLSFMRMERVSAEDKLSIRNPLAIVVNALTMTIGNINDATLEMNALAIKDMRLTLPDLQTRITYHYRQEVLRQLYRILGSADFIGNPVGLFTNVSSGVADIFYEPFNGAVMHGNRELGVGIAKGAASFVKKTVFGLSDTVTKVTGSIGKGLSAATLDSEYQKRRRMNQRRNKPRHAIYGVAAGAEAFASSVTSGVEGIVMKPLEGAETEGALGFFKGVGKGLVGAVTKPVVGVFDLASNVSEGVRNTTMVFDNPARDRVRLPRHVPSDMVLAPYSAREAQGQYLMKDLEHGAYRNESYVAHINVPGGDNVVLLTTTRVLSFWTKKLRLEWDLPFAVVQGVTVEDRGIRFAHKSGREHDRFVVIPEKASQSWFFGQIAAVVKSYNARRRMD